MAAVRGGRLSLDASDIVNSLTSDSEGSDLEDNLLDPESSSDECKFVEYSCLSLTGSQYFFPDDFGYHAM